MENEYVLMLSVTGQSYVRGYQSAKGWDIPLLCQRLPVGQGLEFHLGRVIMMVILRAFILRGISVGSEVAHCPRVGFPFGEIMVVMLRVLMLSAIGKHFVRGYPLSKALGSICGELSLIMR